MLILTRFKNQQIVVGNDILITLEQRYEMNAVVSVIRKNEKIRIKRNYNEPIYIHEVFGIQIGIMNPNLNYPSNVRIGIDAPDGMTILRSELYLKEMFTK